MRVGSIGYATDQGIGHLMRWFYDAGVVNTVAVFHHSSRTNHPEWYRPEDLFGVVARRPFDWPEIRGWLRSLDAVLFFETPFDWGVIPYCRENGVRTYVMPMYECTPRAIPHQPYRWLCPSRLDLSYFMHHGNAEFIEVPVNETPWRLRTQARRFLHNGGHLGLRGHKGTLEIIQAVRHLKSPLELTIRSQDETGLSRLIRQERWVLDYTKPGLWPQVRFETGNRDYRTLFDDHDVFVMAEKYNGLSLPLREAWASGMAVMTSDRFPMNTWLPRDLLIPVAGYSKAAISGAYMEYDEARVEPEAIAAKMDAVYGTDVSRHSAAGRSWARGLSWDAMRPVWLEALSR
jgi:hypothetical protein